MPANVTPEYEKAEQRFREAATDAERLDALQQMLSTIPKHKGTEKMQADIKRRISQLRKAEAKKGPGKGPDPFHVPRGGAGQVVLVGPPNAGKSALVAATTNAPVKVAAYPFTTALPAPGMWEYEQAQIQLVDTPPLSAEHVPGGLFGTINAADVLCVVVDLSTEPLAQADATLALLAGRGLKLRSVPRTELDPEDPHERSALLIATKADRVPEEDIATFRELYGDRLEIHAVSAETGRGLEGLARRVWELLAVIRVYTKEPGRPADFDRPFTLSIGSTVEALAREIHRDLPEKMKFARVWGEGRFDGQHVQRAAELHDRDVVEIHQ